MKNWEKYEEKVKEVNYKFGVIGNEIERCATIICKDCIFSSGLQCNPERIKWLYEDYEEAKPKLTKKERAVVEAFSSAMSAANYHIARGADGTLCIYDIPPARREHSWNTYSSTLILNPNLFPFITWESGKAWSIGELMELKVKE